MSEDKSANKVGKSEAEYKYAEDLSGQMEEMEPEAEPATPKPSLKTKLLTGTFKKKLMIVLFIISIASVVYQFMGSQSNRTATQEEKSAQMQQLKQEAMQHAKQKPAAPTVAVTAPKPAAELPAALPIQPTRASQEALNNTVKILPTMGGEVSSSEVKDLQAGLQATNQAVDDLQTALLNLATSVQKLSADVKDLAKAQQTQKESMTQAMQAAPKSTKVKRAMPKEMGRLVFNVRSLVPGRAWLYTQQGSEIRNLVTVKVGDLLGGYGLIENIDPKTGSVLTSAGGIITYGPNDS